MREGAPPSTAPGRVADSQITKTRPERLKEIAPKSVAGGGGPVLKFEFR